MPIMMAYWLTLAFPLVYCLIYWARDGDMTPTSRGDHYACVVLYICIGVVVVGALIGIWMSALVPGLYG